jgi:hypothetical protein
LLLLWTREVFDRRTQRGETTNERKGRWTWKMQANRAGARTRTESRIVTRRQPPPKDPKPPKEKNNRVTAAIVRLREGEVLVGSCVRSVVVRTVAPGGRLLLRPHPSASPKTLPARGLFAPRSSQANKQAGSRRSDVGREKKPDGKEGRRKYERASDRVTYGGAERSGAKLTSWSGGVGGDIAACCLVRRVVRAEIL